MTAPSATQAIEYVSMMRNSAAVRCLAGLRRRVRPAPKAGFRKTRCPSGTTSPSRRRVSSGPHPFLETGPGVAPPPEPPGAPIPDERFKLKPHEVDLPIGKIGTSDGAVDTFLDAVTAFERERVIIYIYTDPTTDGLQCRVGRRTVTWLCRAACRVTFWGMTSLQGDP